MIKIDFFYAIKPTITVEPILIMTKVDYFDRVINIITREDNSIYFTEQYDTYTDKWDNWICRTVGQHNSTKYFPIIIKYMPELARQYMYKITTQPKDIRGSALTYWKSSDRDFMILCIKSNITIPLITCGILGKNCHIFPMDEETVCVVCYRNLLPFTTS